ncbi:hypothetical protein XBJ2_1240025 [Xenorhabdus bovienii str. Jollieti]|uniref:Uncharacterized protein n=1 Tax=Xenorhabdus bovienii (strain SS-2004) TaxID=406818 RepID=D3V225_XENBS|nr:hypothetical protein XBJ1_2249 [Xenorhabdus bovienii SS-2004]CDH27161.1 hypothetical protein XBJ2_1240025 [Xenorhabdus bovienii str. Jollieti]
MELVTFPPNFTSRSICDKTHIAIINGRMKAGLFQENIEFLGKERHLVAKVSRRDLPFVVAEEKHGATTVASTMIIAEMAGIAD